MDQTDRLRGQSMNMNSEQMTYIAKLELSQLRERLEELTLRNQELEEFNNDIEYKLDVEFKKSQTLQNDNRYLKETLR